MESCRDNRDDLAHLCAIHRIRNPIQEEDLHIAKLIFKNAKGETHVVEATEMNRGGRLFIEFYASVYGADGFLWTRSNHMFITSSFAGGAMKIFGGSLSELSPTYRSLLYGLANYSQVEIIWKDDSL